MQRTKIWVYSISTILIFLFTFIISLNVNTWLTSLIRALVSSSVSLGVIVLFDYIINTSIQNQQKKDAIEQAEKEAVIKEDEPNFEQFSIEEVPKVNEEETLQSAKAVRQLLNEKEE